MTPLELNIAKAISTLRINIKSLAAESSIIKHAFRKYKNEEIRNSLHLHRIINVRKESRITQLTLAAVKGTPYENVERNADVEPNWKKIIAKIDRHSSSYELKSKVGIWIMQAQEYWRNSRS